MTIIEEGGGVERLQFKILSNNYRIIICSTISLVMSDIPNNGDDVKVTILSEEPDDTPDTPDTNTPFTAVSEDDVVSRPDTPDTPDTNTPSQEPTPKTTPDTPDDTPSTASTVTTTTTTDNVETIDLVIPPKDTIEPDPKTLSKLLESEKLKASEYERKFKIALADFQNQSRKTQSDIANGIAAQVDDLLLDFLKIYDDFTRAKNAFSESGTDTSGLDAILKNMNSLLDKRGVTSIDALGEIFDPNVHEAISIVHDPSLDESTITKEIRKGYMLRNRIIRATLVEISKKEV